MTSDQHQLGGSKNRRNAAQVAVVCWLGTIATWSQPNWLAQSFGLVVAALIMAIFAVMLTFALWSLVDHD